MILDHYINLKYTTAGYDIFQLKKCICPLATIEILVSVLLLGKKNTKFTGLIFILLDDFINEEENFSKSKYLANVCCLLLYEINLPINIFLIDLKAKGMLD